MIPGFLAGVCAGFLLAIPVASVILRILSKSATYMYRLQRSLPIEKLQTHSNEKESIQKTLDDLTHFISEILISPVSLWPWTLALRVQQAVELQAGVTSLLRYVVQGIPYEYIHRYHSGLSGGVVAEFRGISSDHGTTPTDHMKLCRSVEDQEDVHGPKSRAANERRVPTPLKEFLWAGTADDTRRASSSSWTSDGRGRLSSRRNTPQSISTIAPGTVRLAVFLSTPCHLSCVRGLLLVLCRTPVRIVQTVRVRCALATLWQSPVAT
eukprot:scaffold96384_cov42-Prasinocladus_malaysianus.AAC.1